MKYFLWIFIGFISFTQVGYAQSGIPDSLSVNQNDPKIQLLEFDRTLLEDLRTDGDFQYIQPPDSRPNFLKMLFSKFFDWLVYVFGNEFFAWLVLFILIIVGAVGLGFAMYGLFGIGKTFPVYGGDPDGLKYVVKAENIHEINFDEEIDLAVIQGNYKKAIRLVYLFSLKLLTDRGIIDWQAYKTNHDYVYEIKDTQSQDQFLSLGYYYEYVWYGDFQAEESHYRSMDSALSELKKNLKGND